MDSFSTAKLTTSIVKTPSRSRAFVKRVLRSKQIKNEPQI